MKPKKYTKDISKLMADIDYITKALRKGVRDALIVHKRMGHPIVVNRNGKPVWIPAEEIKIPDEE